MLRKIVIYDRYWRFSLRTRLMPVTAEAVVIGVSVATWQWPRGIAAFKAVTGF